MPNPGYSPSVLCNAPQHFLVSVLAETYLRYVQILLPSSSPALLFLSLTMTASKLPPSSDTRSKVIMTFLDHPTFSCAKCTAVIVRTEKTYMEGHI